MNDQIKLDGTHIVVIEDRSGSMASMGNIPMEKVNNFIKEQSGDNVTVDVWVFNDTYDLICKNKNPRDVNITKEDVTPHGGTALYETLGNIIDITGMELSLKIDVRPMNVIFVIFTDGDENSSKGEYMGEAGRVKVKKMIEHQQNVYRWTFFFLGSNIDAIDAGTSIGITRQTCINYSSDPNGYDKVFRVTSEAVSRLKTIDPTLDRNESLSAAAFKEDERNECMVQSQEPPPKLSRMSSVCFR
jgi:hypothetical protein